MRTAGSQNRSTPQKRRALLDGALEVFLRLGLTAATLDMLCRELSIGRSSFYHFFPSKEALAVELFGEAITRLNGHIGQAMQASQGAESGLKSLVRSYLEWFRDDPQLGAFVWRVMDSELLVEHIQPVRAQQRAFIDGLFDWLAPFQESGQVRTLSPAVTAALVIGPARDFVRGAPSAQDYPEALRVLPEAAWQAMSGQQKRDQPAG